MQHVYLILTYLTYNEKSTFNFISPTRILQKAQLQCKNEKIPLR